MWSETAAVRQASSVVHPSPSRTARKAVTPLPRPFWITRSRWRIGVCEVVVDEVVKGRLQSSAPSAKRTPTKCSWVKTTTCCTPPSSNSIGEP